jgi:hypothetical protein
MKKIFFAILCFTGLISAAQKETNPVLFKPGILFGTVPQLSVSGTDTTLQNVFSFSPLAGIYANGFGFQYAYSVAPALNTGSAYMQSIRVSFENFDKGNFDVYTTYTHLFFNSASSVLTTPLKNILTGYTAYKELWLKPLASFSYGFGKDEKNLNQNQVNVAGGVVHGFSWTGEKVSFEFDPALTLNAGTTQFYNAAFGSLTGSQSVSPISKKHGRGGTGNSGSGSSSTTQTSAQFTLNNLELGTYSDLAFGNLHFIPMAIIFFPVNKTLSTTVSSFWQLELNYAFNLSHHTKQKTD